MLPSLSTLLRGKAIMWSVWYCTVDEPVHRSDAKLFISDVPTWDLAHRIAENLESDGFAIITWLEKD